LLPSRISNTALPIVAFYSGDYYTGEESLSPVIVKQNYDGYDERVLVRRLVNVGDVRIDQSNLIGHGAYGEVFAGTFKGEKVAVKRVRLMDSEYNFNREVRNNQQSHQLLNHPNIVQFKHFEKNNDFG
jgi:hypothetical protein